MDERKIPVAAVLAVVISLGFFTLIIWLTRTPDKNHDALNVLVGTLSGGWTAVVGYYFGSSAGSRDKDRLLLNKESK